MTYSEGFNPSGLNGPHSQTDESSAVDSVRGSTSTGSSTGANTSSIGNNKVKMSLDFIAPTKSTCTAPGLDPPKILDQPQLPNFEQFIAGMGHLSPEGPTINDIPLVTPQTAITPRPSHSTASPRPSVSPQRHKEAQHLRALAPNGVLAPRPRRVRTAAKVLETRDYRQQYDAEEQYAVIFLRDIACDSKLDWAGVVERFNKLFPVGMTRRCSYLSGPILRSSPKSSAPKSPGVVRLQLSPTYTARSIGGLQCRYYRLLEQEGKSKGSKLMRKNTVLERMVLNEMERRGLVGEKFLGMLVDVARRER